MKKQCRLEKINFWKELESGSRDERSSNERKKKVKLKITPRINREEQVLFNEFSFFFFQKQRSRSGSGRKSGTKRLTYRASIPEPSCSSKITSKNNINPRGDALFIRRDTPRGDSLSLYLPDTSHIYTSLATWKRNRRGKERGKKKKKGEKGGGVARARFGKAWTEFSRVF